MKDIEYILEFITEASKRMLIAGANLERVNLTAKKLCQIYDLNDVNIHSFCTFFSISAKDEEGNYAQRQVEVSAQVLNLELLRKINDFCFNLEKEKVKPNELMVELNKIEAKPYPWYIVLGGFLIAMATLCRIFGGTWSDILVALFNTCVIYGLTYLFGKIKLNHIITNFVSIFVVCTIAIGAVHFKLANNFYCIIITNAFHLIPGIPMVNSVRNLLCGNEQNGIIELLKVCLEVIILVAGIAASYYLFGSELTSLEENIIVNTGFWYDIELIVISFFCTFGFSLVFNIRGYDLLIASLGGFIIRIVYILMQKATDYRVIYTVVAALSAALFAEIVAIIKHRPSTLYLYPSIVPLIPGDLVYYSMLGIIWMNPTLLAKGIDCLLSLVSISLGFVICSSIMHYARKIKFKKLVDLKNKLKKSKQ